MNVDEIRKYCMAFPETTEKLQWGDALCFKVRTKMFAVLGLDQIRFTFKCTPETFADLIERENIRPAPYLGHHNWVMLDQLDALRNAELQEFVRQSYEMVIAKAPGRGRVSGEGSKKKTAPKKSTRKGPAGSNRRQSKTKS
jgi:predicted DNA-binding protein (MmcQ/YjbR family)